MTIKSTIKSFLENNPVLIKSLLFRVTLVISLIHLRAVAHEDFIESCAPPMGWSQIWISHPYYYGFGEGIGLREATDKAVVNLGQNVATHVFTQITQISSLAEGDFRGLDTMNLTGFIPTDAERHQYEFSCGTHYFVQVRLSESEAKNQLGQQQSFMETIRRYLNTQRVMACFGNYGKLVEPYPKKTFDTVEDLLIATSTISEDSSPERLHMLQEKITLLKQGLEVERATSQEKNILRMELVGTNRSAHKLSEGIFQYAAVHVAPVDIIQGLVITGAETQAPIENVVYRREESLASGSKGNDGSPIATDEPELPANLIKENPDLTVAEPKMEDTPSMVLTNLGRDEPQGRSLALRTPATEGGVSPNAPKDWIEKCYLNRQWQRDGYRSLKHCIRSY